MSAPVLLNLLNELRKRDKMRGLLSILSLFRKDCIKFNNTGARMLDFTYHMILKLVENRIFGVKTSITLLFTHLIMTSLSNVTKSVNH